ncbi:MAG: FMN-binding protein [Bacteroidota bacterium]|nr:FMN-binding protein [Bacteroidota bacterium]
MRRISEYGILFILLCVGTVVGQSRARLEEIACRQFGADGTLRAVTLSLRDDDLAALKSANGRGHAWDKVSVYAIEKHARTEGVMMVDNVKGKSRPITYAVIFDRHGGIAALEILTYRESHGGEVRSEAFRRQFEGKRPGDAIAVGRDIRNISGATISSRSVTNGARALVTLHRFLKEKGLLP